MRRIVVVGGSLAGNHAAQALRDLGHDGELTIVGDEPHLPYDRYPLSKGFLTGRRSRRSLDINDHAAAATWRLGDRAVALDATRRLVVLADGTRLPFDGLVVASGSRPRDQDTVAGADGAFVLRTVEDAAHLRAALGAPARRVVVVGGGLIGAEVAAAAARRGHDTILVDPSDLPGDRAFGAPIAGYVLGLHRAAGVRLHLGTRARRLDTGGGAVTGVLLEDGTRLDAGVVVMATGTSPNVEWLAGSGLATAAGLRCSPTLHAGGSGRVVGAGDVVSLPHPLLSGERCRLEHWASTLDQAALAAANLLAGPEASTPLTAAPTWATTIHRARIRSVGYPQAADRARIVWGAVEDGESLVALGRGDQLVAVVSLNAHDRLAGLEARLRPGARLDDLARDGETVGAV